MEGPTRSQGDSAKEVPEVDYMQRIMRSLTDSSTSPAQSADQDSGMGSGSYSFIESHGRIPDIVPGLNPWGFFPPLPELRGLVTESSEPGSWRSPDKDFSPIQREILEDFPWLKEELAASTSVVSKEESEACTTVGPLEPYTDQVVWDQSILELHAFENSTSRSEEVQPVLTRQQQSPVRFVDQALSTSLTPATSDPPFNSESLSSSLSDGEAELQERTRKGSESGTEAAGTSAQSGKRKRPEEEDEEDAPSDDQETSKKPISRPRKKVGVKRVREPRYAIKTRTDTEVMDDGYRWRKYGQKAVKNSPHPRNYYRCTTANCPVRKRVERCFDDPGLVVTTYEGTHTHQAPTFLRGPPGYPGGLQGLLATLSHHYNLTGSTPSPPSNAFPISNSDLYRSSRMSSAQPPIQENSNLPRAHEQLLKLQQQEAAWRTSIKNEPRAGNFQCPGQGSRFSGVSSLSDLSYDTRMSSLTNASRPEQLGHSQFNPLEYSSLMSNGPFNSVVGLPDRSAAASSDSGLLEDIFRHTNPSSSRA